MYGSFDSDTTVPAIAVAVVIGSSSPSSSLFRVKLGFGVLGVRSREGLRGLGVRRSQEAEKGRG